jgi:hypothetical protein
MAMVEVAEGAEEAESAETAKVAAASSGSSSKPSVSAPSLHEDQSLTWSLLLILAIVVVWVSPWGKWLSDIVSEITTYHQTNLNFFPLAQTSSSGGSSSGGGSSSSQTSNNTLVHGFTIPLAGGGSITTNSTSQAGAIANVESTGNTPA